MNKALQELLQRTSLTIPFDIFLKDLKSQYSTIGEIVSYNPIVEGYESANIMLKTSVGMYVIKIFESERQRGNIDSLVKILEEAGKIRVTVPKFVKGKDGPLNKFNNNGDIVVYYITHFFNGENYESKIPSLSEMITITKSLANLNTLNFPVVEAYDTWGNTNLVREYKKNKNIITDENKKVIESIVEEMRFLNMQSFSKSVIHGDMQRKHVLKNKNDEYCVLDFGCARNDYKVFDLSTYLAWFCLSEETWKDKDEILDAVIKEYTNVHSLTMAELNSIPLLIQAAYAAYYLRTSQLMYEGDRNKETADWYEKSKKMISLSNLF